MAERNRRVRASAAPLCNDLLHIVDHYSLLYRSSARTGIIDYCREHDVRFFSYMVLEQGR